MENRMDPECQKFHPPTAERAANWLPEDHGSFGELTAVNGRPDLASIVEGMRVVEVRKNSARSRI